MKNFFLLLFGLGFFAGMIYLFWVQPAPERYNGPNSPSFEQNIEIVEILAGENVIYAEIVDTPSRMTRGLSGREPLNPDEGMLFVYDESKIAGIWMKDMHFSIDILWLDEEKRVTWIEKDVSPDSFPEVFRAEEPVRYVLELLAGSADRFGIDTGSVLSWRR